SMEKRAVLAAVLMALVFVLGQYLFFPSTPETPPGQKSSEQPTSQPTDQSKPSTAAKTEPPAVKAPSPRKEEPKTPTPPAQGRPAERPAQRLATVETPLYHAVVSSEGGKLQELTLQYRGSKPMVIVGELGPGGLTSGSAGQMETIPMQLSTTELRLGRDR